MENGTAALGTVWQFLRNLNTESLYGPAAPLLGLDPGEMKTCPHVNLFTNIYGSVIYHSRKMEATHKRPLTDQ